MELTRTETLALLDCVMIQKDKIDAGSETWRDYTEDEETGGPTAAAYAAVLELLRAKLETHVHAVPPDAPKVFDFEQAAQIIISTDIDGNVHGIHVQALDAPELPSRLLDAGEEDYPGEHDEYAEVWNRANEADRPNRWGHAFIEAIPTGGYPTWGECD